MILQADTQELFKATACTVKIALIFAPKKPLSKECKFMTQNEKKYLITELLKERLEYADISVLKNETEQKKILRALFNVRMPLPISDDFLRVQDEYLQEEITEKGITSIDDLEPAKSDIYLWQGDITTMYVKRLLPKTEQKP